MHEKPDGAHLLNLARQALLDQISPDLSGDKRYTARLIANAMAIAARELQAGEADSFSEREALENLFGEDREDVRSLVGVEDLGEALQRLRWRLSAEIRAGERDGAATIHALLYAAVTAKLKIVNPRAAKDSR